MGSYRNNGSDVLTKRKRRYAPVLTLRAMICLMLTTAAHAQVRSEERPARINALAQSLSSAITNNDEAAIEALSTNLGTESSRHYGSETKLVVSLLSTVLNRHLQQNRPMSERQERAILNAIGQSGEFGADFVNQLIRMPKIGDFTTRPATGFYLWDGNVRRALLDLCEDAVGGLIRVARDANASIHLRRNATYLLGRISMGDWGNESHCYLPPSFPESRRMIDFATEMMRDPSRFGNDDSFYYDLVTILEYRGASAEGTLPFLEGELARHRRRGIPESQAPVLSLRHAIEHIRAEMERPTTVLPAATGRRPYRSRNSEVHVR